VKQPEELGTLLREFLTSGYFVRSYYLLFEEPLERLRQFIVEQGHEEDKLGTEALDYLDKQIAKFDPESYRAPRIGVRAVQALLNYVGAHRQALSEASTFHFELPEEQKAMYADADYEFTPGEKVDESVFYSEDEIPLDGVALFLGCNFEKASKLSSQEQKQARRIARGAGKQMEEFGGSSFGGEGWGDMLQEDLERPMSVSLRVRLNSDATFSVTGRWMEDGQFLCDYYTFLLEQAAKKAGAEVDLHMIY